jgi:hypothetical protein
MNKLHIRSLALGAALSLAMGGTALAGVITFGSLASQQVTSLGPSATVTQNGVTLNAWAVVGSGTPPVWADSTCPSKLSGGTTSNPCLFYKFTSGVMSETGLGLVPNPNQEIFNPAGIALKVTTPNEYLSSVNIGSVQTGESWQVLGCSMAGPGFGSCNSLGGGVGGQNGTSMVTVSGLNATHYDSYIVDVPCMNDSTSCMIDGKNYGATNGSNNIVLMSATTVPEPGTLALMAAGLFGLGWMVRRRRARQ